MKVKNATKALEVNILPVEMVSAEQQDKFVPVYRVKKKQRDLMGYVERSDRLRGAIEIRYVGEVDNLETEVVYAESDA